MKEFEVIIIETLRKKVKVKASDREDAETIVRGMYHNEEIVLTVDDFCKSEFEVV